MRQDPGDDWVTAERLQERAWRLEKISDVLTNIAVVVGVGAWAIIVVCFIGIFGSIFMMNSTYMSELTISAAVNGGGMILAVVVKGVSISLDQRAKTLRQESSEIPANVAYRSTTYAW